MEEHTYIPTMPQTSAGEYIPTMPQTSAGEYIPTMPQTSAGEYIPTMPQASAGEYIPTMPQTSADGYIPTMPQTSADGYIPTMPQTSADGYMPTMPQANGNTEERASGRLIYTEVPFTDEKGRRFLIDGNAPVSTNTGEAQIYRCKSEDGTGDYVAKILVTLRPDASPKKIRTRKKVLEFLDKYSSDRASHILPLLGHGTVTINGGEYFTDVYPYCEGGDIGGQAGGFSLERLTSDVIPAVNEAIHLFHRERLVHRDLKPDNLFYYDGQIVIGDFGITCELNTDDYAVDTEKIGTLGYFAPELMSEAAIIASDYYSFGQTIWSLYHGEMMYREAIRSHGGFFSPDARNTVSDLMRKNELPGLDEIAKADEFFEVLIRGLLQYDPNVRFGYEDVCKWLAGDKSLYLRVKTLRGDEIFERTIPVNGKDCIDNGQVAAQLSADWANSIDLLYGDTLYQHYKFTLRRDEDAAMIQGISSGVGAWNSETSERAGMNRDVGLSRVILNLSGGKLLSWRGRTFTTQVQISEALERAHREGGDQTDFYHLIWTGLVQEWLNRVGVTDNRVSEELARLQSMAQSCNMGVTVAYYWMCYMFRQDREHAAYKTCRSINEIANMLLASPGTLYEVEGNYCCVENPQLLGFLCALGYDEAISAFLTDAGIDYKRHYEMLFDLFENYADESMKQLVHHAYCEFGPQAHLVWWKRNLANYKFVGQSAKTVEQSVRAISVNPDADLAGQRAALSQLQQNYDDFKELFKVNFLMGLAGIRRIAGKDYIYSGKFGSMLVYHFLDQDAPLGFKYSMGL